MLHTDDGRQSILSVYAVTCSKAPNMTRQRSKAMPRAAEGRSTAYTMQPRKNGVPAASRKAGVAPATPFQPQRLNRIGEMHIRVPVTMPVHMATSPMNACGAQID